MSLVNYVLTATICDRLAGDHRVSALPIDVHCCDGVVSLVGTADTQEQKRLAVDIVSGVMGVRSVVDQIMVKLPPGSTMTVTES